MAKGDIIKAYAEWHDPKQCFAVFLAREGDWVQHPGDVLFAPYCFDEFERDDGR